MPGHSTSGLAFYLCRCLLVGRDLDDDAIVAVAHGRVSVGSAVDALEHYGLRLDLVLVGELDRVLRQKSRMRPVHAHERCGNVERVTGQERLHTPGTASHAILLALVHDEPSHTLLGPQSPFRRANYSRLVT